MVATEIQRYIYHYGGLKFVLAVVYLPRKDSVPTLFLGGLTYGRSKHTYIHNYTLAELTFYISLLFSFYKS